MVDEDEIEVLVITSQRKGKGMLFPKVFDSFQSLCSSISQFYVQVHFNYWIISYSKDKIFEKLMILINLTQGGWEEDESIEDAALRETVEEAGVVGDVEVGSFPNQISSLVATFF